MKLFVSLFLLGTQLSFAQPSEPTARELLAYAAALSTTGDVVQMGSYGVSIRGENLSGRAVRRPKDAISRAAELTMEAAGQAGDTKGALEAIALWASIGDDKSSIPYLRMFSKGSGPFPIFCQATLAETYYAHGDIESAAILYRRFEDLSNSIENAAFAKACAARYYLAQGDSDKAVAIATPILAQTDANKFSYNDGAFAIARSVIKAVPGAEMPANAAQSSERSDALQTAQTALAVKDYEGAITAYLNYRRQYPNEPLARQALLNAANVCMKLQQPERALKLYEEAEVQYGDYSEGWKAAVAASKLLEANGNAVGAIERLKASLQKARTQESSAWITASLADLYAKNKKSDEAATLFLELLTKYSHQDAAKEALKNLQASLSQIADWKKLVKRLQDEAEKSTTTLNRQELSNFRRLILSLYLNNDGERAGATWLKSLRVPQDPLESEWLRKDLAWFNSSVAQIALENAGNLNPKELNDAIDSGLSAWNDVGSFEEGLAGLRAAHALAISSNAPKRANKSLDSALHKLLESEYSSEAKTLLRSYYEFIGDKRGIESVK